MTCIAAVTDGKTVWMGGDSLTEKGWNHDVCVDGKVFHRDEMLIGCCGDKRFGQLVRYALAVPPLPAGECIPTYLATVFMKALRGCFEEHGFQQKRDDRQNSDGDMLIGIRGRLFRVSGWYSFCEMAAEYAAIGSGGEVASGALYATKGQNPEPRLLTALEAAAYHIRGVRGPFTILSHGLLSN